jgi:hypothetical protein
MARRRRTIGHERSSPSWRGDGLKNQSRPRARPPWNEAHPTGHTAATLWQPRATGKPPGTTAEEGAVTIGQASPLPNKAKAAQSSHLQLPHPNPNLPRRRLQGGHSATCRRRPIAKIWTFAREMGRGWIEGNIATPPRRKNGTPRALSPL